MAARGRKPKPVEDKAMRGNPGKRSLVTVVGAPAAGAMICPLQVQKNERALAYWQMTLANVAAGHLAPVDAPLLARYCMCLARTDEAETKMDESGGMLVQLRAPNQHADAPPRGAIIQSPFMAIINRQTELARKLAAELALPPAERNRIGLTARPHGTAGKRDRAKDYLD